MFYKTFQSIPLKVCDNQSLTSTSVGWGTIDFFWNVKVDVTCSQIMSSSNFYWLPATFTLIKNIVYRGPSYESQHLISTQPTVKP